MKRDKMLDKYEKVICSHEKQQKCFNPVVKFIYMMKCKSLDWVYR